MVLWYNEAFLRIFPLLPLMTIDNVKESIRQYCRLGMWFIDILRWLGFLLLQFLAGFIDVVEVVFDEISKIDLSSIIDLTNFNNVLTIITWSVLGIAVIIAAVISVMKENGNTEYIKYTIIVITAIICFNAFDKYMVDMKNFGIDTIDYVFSGGDGAVEDKTLSQRIFYLNSYDMLRTIQDENQTLHSINMHIPMYELDINEKMDLDDLAGTLEYDDDGNTTVNYFSTSNGGFFTGDLFAVKYYRYYVDFIQCALLMIVCMIVYGFSAIKLAYLIVNWFFSKVYGTVAMGTSVSNLNKVKMVYTAILEVFISILVTCAGLKIFELILSAIMWQSWIFWTKGVMLFVSGYVTILGASNVNKFFGIDDGTHFMLKSFMLTRAMRRMGKGLMNVGRYGMNFVRNNQGMLAEFNRGNFDGYDLNSNHNPFNPDIPPNTPIGNVDDTSNHIAGNLTSQDMPEIMYGSENADNSHYHRPDGVDRYNEEKQKDMTEKIADKTRRYDKGMKMQSEIEQRYGTQNMPNMNTNAISEQPKDLVKVDYGMHKPYSQYKRDYANGDTSTLRKDKDINARQEVQQKQEHQSVNTQDNTTDQVQKSMPSMEYRYKPYDQYKRDYANGDTSVFQKQTYSKNLTQKKTLPTWWYDQDTYDPEQIDDKKLVESLKSLGQPKNEDNQQADDEDMIEYLNDQSQNAYEEFLKSQRKG